MSGSPDPDTGTLFDRLASGYDHEALRLFPFSADRLVTHARIRPGERVLDVATGTGAVALAAAQMAAPGGRVTGIDRSEPMLARAEEKARALGLSNVDLHRMDAGALDFRREYFDTVLCGFGLFFMDDMAAAVREWARVMRPGGRLVFSSFAPGSFEPLATMLQQALAEAGVPRETLGPPLWHRLIDARACRDLCSGAGLGEVRIAEEALGYHLRGPTEWWDVVWNSGLRARVEHLAAAQRERLRAAHLAAVARTATADGIRLEVNVRFVLARKPVAAARGG